MTKGDLSRLRKGTSTYECDICDCILLCGVRFFNVLVKKSLVNLMYIILIFCHLYSKIYVAENE